MDRASDRSVGSTGREINRREDKRLLTGQGRYADDAGAAPNGEAPLWAVFLRSDLAHARIAALDVAQARAMPGVAAVLTAADLAADGVAPVQDAFRREGPEGRIWQATPRPLLASDRLRHVGEPLAMVLARTEDQARDAAEAIQPALEELPAIASMEAARASGAPELHEGWPGNLAATWAQGDWQAAGAAIAAAHHQVRLDVPVSRITAHAMEPRAATAYPLETGRYGLWLSHQNPMNLRPTLAGAFGLRPEDIRVHTGDIGGSFGMKGGALREEILLFWAMRRLGRACRWRASRSESFLADEAGRDVVIRGELGLDAKGCFTAMRFGAEVNVGAYVGGRSFSMIANFGGLAGVYRTPLVAGRLSAWMTNTVPTAPYRGAGRPEATLAVESLIDAAAHQCGFDRVELRQRNLIGPDQMPWEGGFIYDYDSGDFPAILQAGMARADWDGFAGRQADSRGRGLLRGLGLALCVETSGGVWGRANEDRARVEFLPGGEVALDLGVISAGTGLETSMTEAAARQLGIAPERIRYGQGDTDRLARGKGMGGSSAMALGLPALKDGLDKALAKARDLAGEMLEVATGDLTYAEGAFTIVGTDRSVTLHEVADEAATRGLALLGEGHFAPDYPTFPNGCHICEVEIDPETGALTVAGYTCVEDIGTVLHPQMAEGQIQGGVAQGLAQVLGEAMEFDADGQVLTGSLMDYSLPRAGDLPMMSTGFRAVPTAVNPQGVKGVGEAGSVGALAAGMSAVNDALRRAGAEPVTMPATPLKLWQALNKGR